MRARWGECKKRGEGRGGGREGTLAGKPRAQDFGERSLDTFTLEQEIARSDRPARLLIMAIFFKRNSSLYFSSYKHGIWLLIPSKQIKICPVTRGNICLGVICFLFVFVFVFFVFFCFNGDGLSVNLTCDKFISIGFFE